MPVVPYSPVPIVAPTEAATPRPQVNTPLAAFGGAVGEALSGLGRTTEQAGNELFGRAIALQQLNNETEAREADAKYMMQAGELHANYNALQGKDRVDAFPKYSQDLQDLRTKIRSSLSNPMAQKMYDASSLSTMGRSIFNGAGAAAAANKEWTINTTKSQIDLDVKTVEDNPNDEGLFQQKLSRIQNSARSLSAQQGFGAGSAQEQDIVLKATSKAWSQRIIGLSFVAPFQAAKMLDDNRTAMTSDDRLKVYQIVRAQGRAVGADNIVNGVYSPNKTLADMEGEVKDKAEKLNSDDPLLASHAVTILRTKYNQDHYAKRQEELAAKQDIAAMIQQYNPHNLQEFLQIPGASSAYSRLQPVDQNAIPAQINRYITAKGKYDNDLRFTQLKGMAISDDPKAREAFLDLDPTKENLSQSQIRSVMEMQRKLKNDTEGDPRVNKSITYLRGSMGAQLEALGIYKRTDANKEDYDHYIGALQTGLDLWQENHGRPATYKDITETIGPQIIRERTEPGFFNVGGFGTTNQVPFFKQTVPEEFAARARSIAQNPNLPDEQIYKLWVRYQYQNLYNKPVPKTESRVP